MAHQFITEFPIVFSQSPRTSGSTKHACTKCNLITNWVSHDQHISHVEFNETTTHSHWLQRTVVVVFIALDENRVCCDPLFALSYHRRRAFKFKTKVTQNGLDSLVLYKCCSAAAAAATVSSSERIWLRVWPHAESALLYAGLVVIIICFISSFLSFFCAAPTVTTQHIRLSDVLCEDADLQVIYSMYWGEHVEKETNAPVCVGVGLRKCNAKKRRRKVWRVLETFAPCIRLNGVLLQRLHKSSTREYAREPVLLLLVFVGREHTLQTLPTQIVSAYHFSHRWKTPHHPKGKQIVSIVSWHPFGISDADWIRASCWRSMLAKIGSQVWQRVSCRVRASYISRFA